MRRTHEIALDCAIVLLWAALGVAIGLAVGPARNASAHLDGLVHVQPYSFTNSGCTNRVDPVSVVFYYSAPATKVNSHAAHHGGDGGWDEVNHLTTDQYFYNHNCGIGSGEAADGHFWNDRYHVRHRQQAEDPGELWLGFYSLGTPHFEKSKSCGHAVNVPEQTWPTASSGFVAGKWELVYRWSNWGTTPHLFGDSQYWGNTQRFSQCDGSLQGNDGWVDFLEIQ